MSKISNPGSEVALREKIERLTVALRTVAYDKSYGGMGKNPSCSREGCCSPGVAQDALKREGTDIQ